MISSRSTRAAAMSAAVAMVLPDGTVGEFTEQPLVRPPVKYHVREGQGMTCYQTAGVILDLEVGTYVSRFHAVFPDFPEESSVREVTLVITPD